MNDLSCFDSDTELRLKIQEVLGKTAKCHGFILLCVSAHDEGVQILNANSGELKPQVMETFLRQSKELLSRVALNKLMEMAKPTASAATN